MSTAFVRLPTVAAHLGLMLCVIVGAASPTHAAVSFNVELLGHIDLGPDYTVADVWVDGDLAYVARQREGLSIVDISNPATPTVVGTFNPGPGSYEVTDVKVHNGFAYLTNESPIGIGLAILDVGDPAHPVLASAIVEPVLSWAHNVWVSDGVAYVIGLGESGRRTYIFDVSDPFAPEHLTTLPTPGSHDVVERGGVLYESGGWSGLRTWVVVDPAHPILADIADSNDGDRPHFHTHNAWPSVSGQHVFSTNEIASDAPGEIRPGGLKVWEWSAGGSLEQVGSWRPQLDPDDTLTTIHNVKVVGDYAYVSHYQSGLRILDITNPRAPVEVAFYDTFLGEPMQLFEGAWGVDANEGMRAVVSDRHSGLYVVQFNGARAAEFAGIVTSQDGHLSNAHIELQPAGRTVDSGVGGKFFIATGSGLHSIRVTRDGYKPLHMSVELVPGVNEGIEIILERDTGDDLPSGAPTTTLQLMPASPNPFSSLTTFGLAGRSWSRNAEIDVFDATGHRVRTLVPTRGGRVEWDGRTAAGALLPNGHYFARIVGAPATSPTRRVILIR